MNRRVCWTHSRQEALLDTVERINRELGVAVLLTEHRLDAVFPVCDRVLVMDGGKLRIDGAPAKIASQLAQETEKERLYYGLPAPVRICGELGADPIPFERAAGTRIPQNDSQGYEAAGRRTCQTGAGTRGQAGAFLQGGLDALRLHRAGRFARSGIAAI